jgi:Skp family chaperone for outer membrane proteins
MNRFKFLPLVNTFLIVIFFVFYIISFLNKETDLVFVDQTKLFNEFHMTKEEKANEERKMISVKENLDSIFNKYQNVLDKESQQALVLRSQIEVNNKLLQDIQGNYISVITPKILTRLNTYIQEYANVNSLEFVLSSDTSKKVIYVNSSLDYTNAILEYVNSRYEGGASLTKNQ